MSGGKLGLFDEKIGREVVGDLKVADTFFSRFIGLQGRRCLGDDEGLLIVPCASVHTFFMRFDIDLVMLDRFGTVTGVRAGARPWRLFGGFPQTYAVLEVASGRAAGLRAGDRLRVRSLDAAEVPASLAFLAA